jgi:predicted naringenin-chalcone synthase
VTATILGVATVVPEHRLDAAEALGHLRNFWPQLEKLAEADATLGTRYTCEPVDQLLRRRTLDQLRESYLHHARRLALASAERALRLAGVRARDIDLVITVSCTGYLVPSLDVHMSEALGFRSDILRLPITELGCSGGAAAIAAAHRHLLAFPDHKVLVMAVEVPSLSFQQADRSIDNLTACLVFGDGAGAAVLGTAGSPSGRLQIVRAASHLVPRSTGILGFDLGEGGFHVVLDRKLPRILLRELKPAVEHFLAAGEMREPDFYAVHAAGPRVFDAIETALGLDVSSLDVSRAVFAEVGNTSSAAIFFTLEKVIGRGGDRRRDGLGLGIGPGISVELMQLAWVPAR